MSDELDALKTALRDATPIPDPAERARAISLAIDNHESLMARQGVATVPGATAGLGQILHSFLSRPAFAGAAAVAGLAVCVAVILPVASVIQAPDAPAPMAAPLPAPAVASSVAEADTNADPAEAEAAAVALAPPAPPSAISEAAPPAAGETAARAGADAAASGAGPSPYPAASSPGTTGAMLQTVDAPVATLPLDVGGGGWPLVRAALGAGRLPGPEDLRIREMVAHFTYAYPYPAGDAELAAQVSVMPTPWNANTRLVTIGLQAALPDMAARPPLNLVLLVDMSVALQEPDQQEALLQSVAHVLDGMRPGDRIAILSGEGGAGTILDPVPASDRSRILAAVEGLMKGAAPVGPEAAALAYRIAAGMAAEGGTGAVLLATGSGQFGDLKATVAAGRKDGIGLGILLLRGNGGSDLAASWALAQAGGGMVAEVGLQPEADKAAVERLTKTLIPVAHDVQVQVAWDPAAVSEYRLIGGDAQVPFGPNGDPRDRIGAGTQMTAIYEVVGPTLEGGALGSLQLRWTTPEDGSVHLIELPVTDATAATGEARFAAAIAGFGLLLSGADLGGSWGWDDAITLAANARGSDPGGQRTEALDLMLKAQTLAR